MKCVESLGLVFWIAILTGTQAQVAPSVAIFLDNVSEELFLSTKTAFNGSQAAVITVHNITGLAPFQLFKKACSTASSGAIAIATQTTCPTVLTLSYAADTLGLGFIGKEGGCASSDIHPSSAQEKYDAMEDIDQRSIHQALLSTIEALEWKEVLVIFDDEILFKRDKYLTSLDGELAGVKAFFQMFEVRNESRSADITSILSYMAEGDAYDKVLVACSVTCVKETLARAVDYDRSGVEQEFFSFAVNWLILANEDDLDAILPVVQTLNHVTVITPPSKAEMDTVVVKDLIEIVNGSVNYLKHGNYSEWEMKNTTCGIKLGLVNQTEEQMLAAFNTTLSKTAPFTYYAAMWKPGGVRRFENVAQWTASDQPPTFDDVFPNVKFGFNGKHLIVGTKTASSSSKLSKFSKYTLLGAERHSL